MKLRNRLTHIYFRIYGTRIINYSLEREGELVVSLQRIRLPYFVSNINHLERNSAQGCVSWSASLVVILKPAAVRRC